MNKDFGIYEKGILNQERFKNFFFGTDTLNVENQPFNHKLLKKELDLHRCTIEKKVAQMFFLFMSKANVNMLNGLYVDMESLNKIKEMTETDRKTKIIFMPVF
jgi:hypothetical protein